MRHFIYRLTKNRIGYYNKLTGKKIYLKINDIIPEGFIKGLMPTTGKKLKTPDSIFKSVIDCMNILSLTRYQINKNIKNLINWEYINE
jgi:hypothetical protein